MLLQQVIHGWPADAEGFRGLDDVAFEFRQGREHHLLFEHGPRFLEGLVPRIEALGTAAPLAKAQFIGRQQVRIGEQYGTPQLVFQLADVSRPAVAVETGQCFGREPGHVLAQVGANALHEIFGQDAHVVAALPQWRQVDVDHADAVVKVLAKTSLGYGRRDIDVRGRDDAHIDCDVLAAAHALDDHFLQEPEQLDLQVDGQFGYFIQKER